MERIFGGTGSLYQLCLSSGMILGVREVLAQFPEQPYALHCMWAELGPGSSTAGAGVL